MLACMHGEPKFTVELIMRMTLWGLVNNTPNKELTVLVSGVL